MDLKFFCDVAIEKTWLNGSHCPLTEIIHASSLNTPLDETHRPQGRGRRKGGKGREAWNERRAKLLEGRPAGKQGVEENGQCSGGTECVTRTGFCQEKRSYHEGDSIGTRDPLR